MVISILTIQRPGEFSPPANWKAGRGQLMPVAMCSAIVEATWPNRQQGGLEQFKNKDLAYSASGRMSRKGLHSFDAK
jgi:hypothetical protein